MPEKAPKKESPAKSKHNEWEMFFVAFFPFILLAEILNDYF